MINESNLQRQKENDKWQLQCFGSRFIDSGSGFSILDWIPIWIQGFDEQMKK